ncbi:MAG: site-specific integrase [Candidatus Bathyarchaeota archaeon]|nr:site-specific integrase [Candidatus Bathyarchaeum sp.]
MIVLAPTCPQCGSTRTWKDGIRHTEYGDIQRYLCRECCYRFSETNSNCSKEPKQVQTIHRLPLNTPSTLFFDHQICVLDEKAKNLVEVESRIRKQAAGATKPTDSRMVTFIWELKKQGFKDTTIRTYHRYLKTLSNRGANLLDPESVKEAIAKQKKWSENTRALAINAYSKFLEIMGGTWKPPKHRKVRTLPFIPLESELDQLISGTNKKTATFLQILKETAMRSGEAWRLKWTDINLKNRTITLNEPEKYGKPRMFKASSTLLAMLQALPKNSDFIFCGDLTVFRKTFRKYRTRMATKLKNPRFKKITFHTFRHWKASIEYHKTKDILHIMDMLGHRDIKTTLIYTQLVTFESDEYNSSTAKTTQEAKELLEAGFEYICTTPQDVMLFRKRK